MLKIMTTPICCHIESLDKKGKVEDITSNYFLWLNTVEDHKKR